MHAYRVRCITLLVIIVSSAFTWVYMTLARLTVSSA